MSSQYKCHTITTLGWSDDDVAKDLLNKASRIVQPIMIKRKFQVPKLIEFFPKNKSLQGLNVNKGQEIKIRLREPSDQKRFYHIEYIVGTLLHELCHNVHGPHNSDFYKLLDELNKELDDFQKKGIEGTGAGFDMEGKKVDNERHNPSSIIEVKKKAAEAAEKRLRLQKLIGKGVDVVGGTKTNLSPREAAARAAERRYNDNLICEIQNDE